jgi:hypothetical protein
MIACLCNRCVETMRSFGFGQLVQCHDQPLFARPNDTQGLHLVSRRVECRTGELIPVCLPNHDQRLAEIVRQPKLVVWICTDCRYCKRKSPSNSIHSRQSTQLIDQSMFVQATTMAQIKHQPTCVRHNLQRCNCRTSHWHRQSMLAWHSTSIQLVCVTLMRYDQAILKRCSTNRNTNNVVQTSKRSQRDWSPAPMP